METNEQIKLMSIPAESSIQEAMQAIDRGMLGMALLFNPPDGRFLGLVTDGDLRRALIEGASLDSPVSNVKHAEPIVVEKGTSPKAIDQIADKHRHVRCIPILDDQARIADLAILDGRLRLPVSEPFLGEQELKNVRDCVLTGWISSAGQYVPQFEDSFASFCGTPYAVATSNGTAALHLALLALDIGPEFEVIVPTLSFIATANAVTYTGARPIFVDSESETWNMDPAQIESAISKKTKAIIVVHLYGHPADMDSIMEIATRHGLYVIEDAAEAHGAQYKGKNVGSIGDIACFSFYGNKTITTGEGGMVVTKDTKLAEKIRLLRDHGMSPTKPYWHTVLGYNYRMTNLQAALGVAQVEKIDVILNAKHRIADVYSKNLCDISGIILPPNADWAERVSWLYSILVDQEKFGISRDDLMVLLKEHGIETRPLFPPIHNQPIYETGQYLPVAERLAAQGLSLPSAVNVQNEHLKRLADIIRSVPLDAEMPHPRHRSTT